MKTEFEIRKIWNKRAKEKLAAHEEIDNILKNPHSTNEDLEKAKMKLEIISSKLEQIEEILN